MAEKIFIIGGGPGGYVTAIKAAQMGMDVTIAEAESFGGTCLNRGCIPTKALLHITSFLSHNYKRMGIKFDDLSYDLDKFRKWKELSVKKAVSGVEMLLKKNGVKIVRKRAFAVAPGKVETDTGEKYDTDHTVIATGSRPFIPSFLEGNDGLWTSDDALEIPEVPERLAIIGAGVIGVEMATLYSRLGSQVHLFDILEQPGGEWVDKEIGEELAKVLKSQKIKLHLGCKIKSVSNNKVCSEETEDDFDRIMVATGRQVLIDSKHSDIETIPKAKALRISNKYETSMKNVYAIGDVVGGAMLAHKASMEGLHLIHILNGDESFSPAEITSVVYTTPEIASCGPTEKAAKVKYGENIQVSKFPISANARANCTKELKGLVKLIAAEGKLIAAHIMSEHASEMIWAFSRFIKDGMNIDDIRGTVFPHPTFSEAIGEAFEGFGGNMIHL